MGPLASTPALEARAAQVATLVSPQLLGLPALLAILASTPALEARAAKAATLASPHLLGLPALLAILASSLILALRHANTPRTPTRDAAVTNLPGTTTLKVLRHVQQNAKKTAAAKHSSSKTVGAKSKPDAMNSPTRTTRTPTRRTKGCR